MSANIFISTASGIQSQNLQLLKRLTPGDVVQISTITHTHWAIYVGNGNVIHCSIKSGNIEIKEELLLQLAKNHLINADYQALAPYDTRKQNRNNVVMRARRELHYGPGECRFKNCEQFVFWCRHGRESPLQNSYDPWNPRPDYDKRKLSECNNFNVIRQLEPGDIVKVKKSVFSFHGVYVGDNRIVYANGPFKSFCLLAAASLFKSPSYVQVLEEDIFNFVCGNVAEIANDHDAYVRPLDRDVIVKRAQGKIGVIPYHSLYKNCQHFACWCRYDFEKSSKTWYIIGILILVSVLVGAIWKGPIGMIITTALILIYLLQQYRNRPSIGYYH
uniref:LRAT domain-containing protein n=1 Tax=Biomphalaria glabrata TaxID=6526 RepID=A0A2C9M5R3_BIOGL